MEQEPKHKGSDVFPGPWSFSACWQHARKEVWVTLSLRHWDRETNRAFEVLACIWYTLVLFFPQKRSRKCHLDAKTQPQFPAMSFCSETKSQDPFNIIAGSNSLQESTQRNGDKAMSRQREGVSSPSGAQGIHAWWTTNRSEQAGMPLPGSFRYVLWCPL